MSSILYEVRRSLSHGRCKMGRACFLDRTRRATYRAPLTWSMQNGPRVFLSSDEARDIPPFDMIDAKLAARVS
jgi:hypothetical protein